MLLYLNCNRKSVITRGLDLEFCCFRYKNFSLMKRGNTSNPLYFAAPGLGQVPYITTYYEGHVVLGHINVKIKDCFLAPKRGRQAAVREAIKGRFEARRHGVMARQALHPFVS